MTVTKRKVVKKARTPAYTPEQEQAHRDQWKKNREEMERINVEHAARKRQEQLERQARLDAELTADKRPRWMRESVVDPSWIEAYNKAHAVSDTRPFPLGSDLLDCVGYAGQAASGLVFGSQIKLAQLARASTDEDQRAILSEERDGVFEVAAAVASIVAMTLDAADDTIPEDAKPGTLPDRTKVDTALRTLLLPSLHKLKIAMETVIGRIHANDDKHDAIGDQLQADLWERASDEVPLPENFDIVPMIRNMSDLERQALCRDLGINHSNLDHLG